MFITPPGPLTSWAKIAIALEVFLAIGALGGGAALLLGPRGDNKPPLQAFYLALGAAIALVGVSWLRHTKSLEPAPETGLGGSLRPRA
jgi:hypothetical protein